MAISILDRVWKKSTSSGNGRLLLLAIADHANENGAAWPGFRLLQQKCNIKNRQTITRNLRQLEIDGELIILPKDGPHGTNWYQISVGMSLEKVDAWREELGAPPRDTLSIDDEIEEEAVTGLNHHEDVEVVTGLNHLESNEVVQSGYESGSILIEGGSIPIEGGHTVEPKPLLNHQTKPSINQLMTSEFKFFKFRKMIINQLPTNSTYAEKFKDCTLHGIEVTDQETVILHILTPDAKTSQIFKSRLKSLCEHALGGMGISPAEKWEVNFVEPAAVQT